jgi:glutathione-specific gamma-glutamylcyclotransferase
MIHFGSGHLGYCAVLLPREAFAHVPELANAIVAPEASRLRLTHATLEAAVRDAGLPDNWLLPHAERDAMRHESLVGRTDGDLWVFAYGALMWDPAIHAVEIRRAMLPGWHRRFCLAVEFFRGTPEQPWLCCALDAGGDCDGLVFRVPAQAIDRETDILWMREMLVPGYEATFVQVNTPQGSIEALAFVVDRRCHRFVDLDDGETARVIARAKGFHGTNRAYFDGLVVKLRELGIADPQVERLANLLE